MSVRLQRIRAAAFRSRVEARWRTWRGRRATRSGRVAWKRPDRPGEGVRLPLAWLARVRVRAR